MRESVGEVYICFRERLISRRGAWLQEMCLALSGAARFVLSPPSVCVCFYCVSSLGTSATDDHLLIEPCTLPRAKHLT